mmetsp:Transcript_25716/g.102644  ORF Transcript_25716/g.102644 Transcript_25716/m.102644 type:complete len:225 (-) Transcript_25716:2512-3186(-)
MAAMSPPRVGGSRCGCSSCPGQKKDHRLLLTTVLLRPTTTRARRRRSWRRATRRTMKERTPRRSRHMVPRCDKSIDLWAAGSCSRGERRRWRCWATTQRARATATRRFNKSWWSVMMMRRAGNSTMLSGFGARARGVGSASSARRRSGSLRCSSAARPREARRPPLRSPLSRTPRPGSASRERRRWTSARRGASSKRATARRRGATKKRTRGGSATQERTTTTT